ncbi:MAG TPA: hypothetical protein VJU87_12605 [Gemmatimonadaceae bacterium]|nr:hypothetical protein [Gemmatimonadaceae bacterium]
MAVREFTDSKGVAWRAWEITPDAIYPPTRAEDYLADCYRSGWVVFETYAGDRRIRVCPTPPEWMHLTAAELEALIESGDRLPVRVSPAQGWPTSGETGWGEPDGGVGTDTSRPERSSLDDLSVVRSFRYPGGRVWTVSVITDVADTGRRVLRFAAGGRAIDLAEWPRTWADLSDEGLVQLLRRAAPRASAGDDSSTPGRRWNDPRP